jgi:uncharacterized membrane protein YjjB (DUF3815 family)
MWVEKLLFSLLGACGFAILFGVPRRYLYLTALIGGLSGFAYASRPSHFPASAWLFLLAFAIGTTSHIMARITNSPAQGFLIPGVVMLVPGSIIYRGFNQIFTENYDMAWPILAQAGMAAIAISFGLLLANWLAPQTPRQL